MKMKRKLYLIIYVAVCAVVWAACTDERTEVYAGDDACIRLGASVVGIESATRVASASVYEGSSPSSARPFEADVCFSNTNGEYGTDGVEPTYVPCHTQMKFDGSLVYAKTSDGANNLKYATTGDNPSSVYCVGFYPKGKWMIAVDKKSATAAIDGSTDLMFASQQTGSWSNPLKELPFNHMLTWLKVCFCATSQEAPAAWGKIERISINSADGLSVNLGAGTVTYNTSTSDIVAVENKTLHTTMQEVGSVLCAPATEYTLTIVTTNAETRTKPLQLTDLEGNKITNEEDVKGKLFILSLYFNEFDVVEGVCTLNAWNNQDEDLYLKGEVNNE